MDAVGAWLDADDAGSLDDYLQRGDIDGYLDAPDPPIDDIDAFLDAPARATRGPVAQAAQRGLTRANDLREARRDQESEGFITDLGNALGQGTRNVELYMGAAGYLAGGDPDELADAIAANAIDKTVEPGYYEVYKRRLQEAGARVDQSISARGSAVRAGAEFAESPLTTSPILAFLKHYFGGGRAEGIADIAVETATSPRAVSYLIAEQLPNFLPSVAGGLAGAGGGALVAGPPGAVAGGLGGMSAGTIATESGAKTIELLHERGVDLTDRDAVAAVLKSPEFRAEAAKAGVIKGAVIAAVDLVSMRLGGKVLSQPAKQLHTDVTNELVKHGVDPANAAAVNAAITKPELQKTLAPAFERYAAATTGAKTGARAAAAGAIETVGEGVGEFAGEEASGGDAQAADVAMEMIGGAGQSVAQAAAGGLIEGARYPLSKRRPEPAASIEVQAAAAGLTRALPSPADVTARPAIDVTPSGVAFTAEQAGLTARTLADERAAAVQAAAEREQEGRSADDQLTEGQEAVIRERADELGYTLEDTDYTRAVESIESRLPVNLKDRRLARDHYRTELEQMSGDIVKGGGVSTITDEHGRIVGRTPSVNPDWFQALARDEKVTVEYVQKAIQTALDGKALGEKQKRVIVGLLDTIRGRRETDELEFATAELDAARALRRETRTGIPSLQRYDAEADAAAAVEYEDAEYAPDWTAEARSLHELATQAAAVDPDATERILDSPTSDFDVARQLWQVIGSEREQQESIEEDPGEPGQGPHTGEAQALEREAYALEAYSEDDLAARQLLEDEAGAAEASTAAKAEADAQGAAFTLTGSDRDADQAAARGQQDRLAVDAAAHEAATSPDNDRPEPTDAQKAAGNYKKGHTAIEGLELTIENPAGSTRSGTARDGTEWSVEMRHHYGYFKRTEGKDGDQVDVFVKEGTEDAPTVYVVDQVDPDTGHFDEHKVILGAESEQDARATYLANYAQGWTGLGAVTAMPIGGFKAWLGDGTRTRKPAASELRPASRDENGSAQAATADAVPSTEDEIQGAQETADAETNRSDQEPAARGGPVEEGREDPGGEDVQRQAQTGAAARDRTARGQTAPGDERSDQTITDVGEELWANRRNHWSKGLTWAAIQGENATLKVQSVTKAKVWPKPDYESLITDGMQPLTARFVKQAYDAIAAKPAVRGAPSDAQLESYIEWTHKVRDAVLEWANDLNAQKTLIERLAQETDLRRRNSVSMMEMIELTGGRERQLVDRIFPADDRAKRSRFWRDGPYVEPARLIGGNRFLKAIQFDIDDAVKALKDIDAGWPAKQEAWQKRGMTIVARDDAVEVKEVAQPDGRRLYALYVNGRYQDYVPSRDDADKAVAALKPSLLLNKHGRVIGSYPGKDAALEAAREHTRRGGATGDTRARVAIEEAVREGPVRRETGQNVTSRLLMDTFGFRGVNFGNWTNQADRQAHLNHAYDALIDLAELVDVPAKALSLNGSLGIAFGAQGRGGRAAAHFVPGVNEINLTRTAGVGVLAHEWAHALDHYFATQAGERYVRGDYPYLTHAGAVTSDTIRPEVVEAFKAIVDTMKHRPLTEPERIERQDAAIDDAQKNVDAWLRYFRSELESNAKANRTETALKGFDALAEAIGKGKLGEESVQVGRGPLGAVPAELAHIREVYRQAVGRVPRIDDVKALASWASSLAYRTKNAEASKSHRPQTAPTSYYQDARGKDAEKRGKHYWSLETELFARAFETYVVDRLDAQTRQNDYLALPWSHADEQGRYAYLRGDERKDVDKAFDTLMETLETRATPQGAALYARPEIPGGPAHGTVTAADVEAVIDRTMQGLGARIHVTAVQREADLPWYLEPAPGDHPKGLYHNGRVWMIAANIETRRAIPKYVAHEVFGHLAPEAAIDDWTAIERDINRLIWDGNARAVSIADEVRRRYPDAIPGFVRAGSGDPATSRWRAISPVFVREFIAIAAERKHKGPIAKLLSKIRAAIRRFLKSIGLTHYLEDYEIDEILRHSEVFLRTNGAPAAGPVMASQDGWAHAVFFSRLRRSIDDIDMPKATPRQWKAMLKKAGVRNDELDWLGIDGFMAGRTSITRDELIGFVDENPILIREVVLGERDYGTSRRGRHGDVSVDQSPDDSRFAVFDDEVFIEGGFDTRADADRAADDYAANARAAGAALTPDETPRFETYQLPGGAHYRELLMTWPAKAPDIEPGAPFYSAHFDEPNVLVHIRFNERADSDGKRVLFIEEIQSDWHQRGRHEGYRHEFTEQQEAQMDAAYRRLRALIKNDDNLGYDTPAEAIQGIFSSSEDFAERWEMSEETEQAANAFINLRLQKNKATTGVPDAPFKKTWPMLAMKRAIRWAAENGYDRVAWTTGEQQAARYNLNRAVEQVDVSRRSSAGGEPSGRGVSLRLNNGSEIQLGVNDEGVIDTTPQGAELAQGWKGQSLADVLGKDLATKAMTVKPPESFAGEDLKVGGEGMTGFYDTMLPRMVGKYVKTWGAKVGKTTFADGPDDAVHTFDITDAMRESVLRGQPLFARGDRSVPILEGLMALAQDEDAFSYPKVRATRMADIVKAVRPGWSYRQRDADIHGIRMGDTWAWIYTPGDGTVILNAGALEPGSGGAALYHIASTYAHNNGLTFVGDPQGLSRMAVVRRTEHMLSSALKYGTTKHLNPAPEQHMPWLEGHDAENIRTLVEFSAKHMAELYPFTRDLVYNFDRGRIEDIHSGRPQPADELARDRLGDMEVRAGRATLARAALYNGLVQSAGSPGWDALLATLAGLGDGQRRALRERSPGLERVLYARGEPAAGGPGEPQLTEQAPLFPSGFDLPNETVFDWLVRNLQDRFRRVKILQRAITEAGGAIPEPLDAYLGEELYHGRVAEMLTDFTRELVDPLVDAMGESEVTLNELDAYLYAKHAPERNAHIAGIREDMPDGGSGMTDAEAAAVLERYAERRGVMEALAERVYAVNRARVALLRAEGLEHPEILDIWENQYTFYVPLRGFVDPDEQWVHRRGRGFDVRGKESKRALGRGSTADSPVLYSIAQMEESLIRAEKNRVGQRFLDLVLQHPNEDLWSVSTNPWGDYKPVFDAQRGEVVYRRDPRTKWADNVVSVKRDGKEHLITLEDEGHLLARALKNLGPDSANIVIRGLARLNRYLAAINTSLNPEFVISNFTRDIQTAMINLAGEQDAKGAFGEPQDMARKVLKDLHNALRGTFDGIYERDPDAEWTKWYREFSRAGGRIAFYAMRDLEQQRRHIRLRLAETRGGVAGSTLHLFNAVMAHMGNINGVVENAVRLSTYVNARRAGLSQDRAASLARNLTVNFTRKGEFGNVANALYLFYNAGLQGSVRLLYAVTASKRVQKIVGGIAVTAFAWGLMNRWIGGEDDDGESRYDKLPNYIKARNIVFMRPDGSYWKLPLPYGYNVPWVAGTYIERAAFSQRGTPMEGAVVLGQAVLESFNPLGTTDSDEAFSWFVKMAAPTVIDPYVELALNENWAGRQIRPNQPPWGPPKPDHQLYFNSVSASSRDVTQAFNDLTGGDALTPGRVDINPETLDHLFAFYTGGVGRTLASAYKLPVKALSETDAIETRDVPFYRRIRGDAPVYYTRTRYYDLKDEIELLKKRAKGYAELGDTKGLKRLHKEQGKLLGLVSALKDTERELRQLYKAKRQIKAIDTIDGTVKHDRLKRIDAAIETVQKVLIRLYNEAA